MEISKVIRRHGFDLATVAREMGILRGSLANAICKGNPQVSYLRKIAGIVGANMTEFFEDEREASKEVQDPRNFDLTALVHSNGEFYRADNLKELEALVKELRAKSRERAKAE